MDASAQPAGRLFQRAKCGVQAPVEGIEIVGSTIGQAGLGIRPHAFIGIEFGSVGWEKLQVEPRVAAAQLPNRFAFVDRGIVEEHDHVASQVAQQKAFARVFVTTTISWTARCPQSTHFSGCPMAHSNP